MSKSFRAFASWLTTFALNASFSFVLASPDAPKAEEPQTTAAVSSAQAPVKIGCIMCQTGVAAEGGQQVLNGIKLFMEQNNNKLAGRPVQLIVENDGSSSETAKQILEKMAEKDHVDVIIGLLTSRLAHDGAPLADKFKVPVILPIGADDDLTQRKRPKWIARVSWSASQTAQPFGEWVFKNLHYKRVAIFSVDYAYGWENAGGFQKSFEEAGGQVVQKIWAPLGLPDYSKMMEKLHKDVDAVYLISTFGASDVMAKQFKQFGPPVPAIGSGSTFDEPMFKYLGGNALGAVSSFSYSAALNNPANKKFVAAYRAKYNEDPGLYSESGYVSAMWVARALEKLHGDVSNKEKLLDALRNVELKDAPRGPMKLDQYGNPVENVYVRRVDNVKGKLQNTVIATFPNVTQFWKWDAAQFLKQPVYSRTFPPCVHCATSD